MAVDWDDPDWGGRVHVADAGFDLSPTEQEDDNA